MNKKCNECEFNKCGVCIKKKCDKGQSFKLSCNINNDKYSYQLEYNQLSNYQLETITTDLIDNLISEMDGDDKFFFLLGLSHHLEYLTKKYMK